MEIPTSIQPMLKILVGIIVFAIGASFAYKCFDASFNGKTKYWTGLQNFGILFLPVTILSPFICHLPAGKESLVKVRQETYVHMFYGPAFFLCALMFLTAGADLMGLPGSSSMNTILTCGRRDIPAAITYTPPFTYRFPILKKAAKTITRTLTHKIPTDKSKSLNALEKAGVDVEHSEMGDDSGREQFEEEMEK